MEFSWTFFYCRFITIWALLRLLRDAESLSPCLLDGAVSVKDEVYIYQKQRNQNKTCTKGLVRPIRFLHEGSTKLMTGLAIPGPL